MVKVSRGSAISLVVATLSVIVFGNACSGDLKVHSQAEVNTLRSCGSYQGTITIDSVSMASLDLGGVSSVNGDIVVTDNGGLTTLTFPDLQTITGTLRLENNTLLSKAEWPSLNAVSALNVTTQPSLSAITFPAHLSRANKISVSDTAVKSIAGITLSGVEDLSVNNNAQLKQLYLGNLSEVKTALCISANSPELDLDLSRLKGLQQGSFGGLADIVLSSLEKVAGDLSFTGNQFSTLEMPNITDVGGTLTLSDNNHLEKLSVPNLEHLGGALLVANNSRLATVEAFPKLGQVDGSVDLTGSFEQVNLPKLRNVRGGLNVQTTSDQFSCDAVNDLKGNVIEGNEFVCKADVANPESNIGRNNGHPNNSSQLHPRNIRMNIHILVLAAILCFI